MESSQLQKSYTPQSRAERVIAGSRVVLAVSTLLTVWLDPSEPSKYAESAFTLTTLYSVYSVVLFVIGWVAAPIPLDWAFGTHVVDLAMFSVFMFLTEGPASPFFVYLVYSLICAALRWGWRGTVSTAAVAMGVLVALALYSRFTGDPAFEPDRFFVRAVYLAVAAALLAHMGAYQERTQRDLASLANWPRDVGGERHALVRNLLARVSSVLRAPHVAVAWEQPEEPWTNIAMWQDGTFEWTHEAPDAMEFDDGGQTATAGHIHTSPFGAERGLPGVPLHLGEGRHRKLPAIVIDRFGVTTAPSWSLKGEGAQGLLFCISRERLTLDDVAIGQVAAHLTTATLDHLYLLSRLREAVASEERVRLARNLHDSVLQSMTGVALQLQTARQLLPRDPAAAQGRLREMQETLAGEQHRLRNFISELRPFPTTERRDKSLTSRLGELRRRIEMQWGLQVALNTRDLDDKACAPLAQEIYHLVNEALINAARHAQASTVSAELSSSNGQAHIEVADDGHGFAFRGRYDLETLKQMKVGPDSLKHRVRDLAGDLVIESSPAGARLAITVPLPVADQPASAQ